jgi:23S rRNA pseudouridine2604 synthase
MDLVSRREADDWIVAGWVRVDGRVAVLGQRVGPDVRIDVDPAARAHQGDKVTILLHKPLGVVSGQPEDGHSPAAALIVPRKHWEHDPSTLRYQPRHAQHLAPAGRLDLDSTGLLVLTQDGRIAKQLIGHDSPVEKEYVVHVDWRDDDAWSDAALARLCHGIELDDVPLAPARVERIEADTQERQGLLRFVLREGRKRQIRRMCEQVGLRVISLRRVRIGGVSLGELPLGQWRYLRDSEGF